ncbi:Flavin-binding monooxygenase [Aspergillus sclerotialis]|uniref:Flavin-binding monooxygenase n=1 Tax=Aspergillus sclerotialis TaxID=2070753 RepID=A0A3A2ZAH8_9EURO|nr:Flavin-binding monooxygenase [Aspergillus sclerotialis]
MVDEPVTVAVIGLGALGLVAMKNLLEVGFDVTGFDKRPYVGGLWQYTEESALSVLESAWLVQTQFDDHVTDLTGFAQAPYRMDPSREAALRTSHFQMDYAIDVPDFPLASDMHRYLVSYARHFGILPRARLSTIVHRAEWNESTAKWEVETSPADGPRTIYQFDKVVCSLGPDQVPNIPQVQGLHRFAGEAVHSIGFKKPEKWAGKRVLVVGFGNTAADIAGVLVGTAEKVYLSHRSGAIILPRWVDNKPVDHIRTYRKGVFLHQLSRYAPRLWMKLMNSFIIGLRNKLYDLRPEWGFDPAPSVNQARPVVSDDLVHHLSNGHIISKPSIQQIIDGERVEFTDGTIVEVDRIIWCTGYTVDYSIVGKSDPTIYSVSEIGPFTTRKVPQLYQNMLSLDHPESLAFMGNLSFMNPAFLMFDLATMALGQIWAGRSKLPSQDEMRQSVDQHRKWIAQLAAKGQVMPGLVKAADWMDWAEEAAGLGMKENLGYGLRGWWFWLTDRRLCNLLMDGLLLPFHYRLFEGKRPRWKDARETILKVHEELHRKNTTKKWQ